MPKGTSPSLQSPSANSGDSIKAVNVRLPKDIINLLDLLIKQGLYSSRSEAVRDFARDHVNASVIAGAATGFSISPSNPSNEPKQKTTP